VFIAAGTTRAEVIDYASKCPLLYVRGDEVFKWALMLAHHFSGFDDMPVSFNQDVMQSYRGVHGVPACLARTAVVASNDQEVDELQAAHLLPRAGYASTRYGSAEDPGARRLHPFGCPNGTDTRSPSSDLGWRCALTAVAHFAQI